MTITVIFILFLLLYIYIYIVYMNILCLIRCYYCTSQPTTVFISYHNNTNRIQHTVYIHTRLPVSYVITSYNVVDKCYLPTNHH